MKNTIEDGGCLIKKLTKENLSDVTQLYTAVYGRKLPLNFFQQKYDTAYTGVTYIGFIAYNAKMIPIAYYGVIPCFLRFGDEIVLSAQSADTMTHPAYRKMGLFVKLAKQTYNLCYNSGIRIIFGFPNQNSLHGFVRQLQWTQTCTMDCFLIPVSTLPFEKLSIKLPFLKKLYATYIQRILKKYKVSRKNITDSALSGRYCGLRDERYLMYKSYSDTHLIQIHGVVLWIKISNGLTIGDFFNAPDPFDSFDQVIRSLIEIARNLGLAHVQFHTSTGTQLHSLFAARFQSIPSFPVIFKEIGPILPIAEMKFSFADIDIF